MKDEGIYRQERVRSTTFLSDVPKEEKIKKNTHTEVIFEEIIISHIWQTFLTFLFLTGLSLSDDR